MLVRKERKVVDWRQKKRVKKVKGKKHGKVMEYGYLGCDRQLYPVGTG